MEIKLYKQKERKNTVNKTLTDEVIKSGTLKEESSIINPVVKFKRATDILDKNYLYIPLFNRYYFINDIITSGDYIEVNAGIDVVETYKDDILDYNATLERSEYDYNLFLIDNEIVNYSDSLIQFKQFPIQPLEANVLQGERKFVMITASD